MSTSLVLALVLLVLLALLVAALVATVRRDGLGSLEPPRSHPADDVVPGWSGRPA